MHQRKISIMNYHHQRLYTAPQPNTKKIVDVIYFLIQMLCTEDYFLMNAMLYNLHFETVEGNSEQ